MVKDILNLGQKIQHFKNILFPTTFCVKLVEINEWSASSQVHQDLRPCVFGVHYQLKYKKDKI